MKGKSMSKHGKYIMSGLGQKIITVCLVGLMIFAGVIPFSPSVAKAEVTQFEQGSGYQQGLYDSTAVQPTVFNWTRQSRFKGPDIPQIQWKFEINQAGYYGPSPSPVIGSDGTVYIGGDKLYAVSPDGTEKWNYNISTMVNTSPVIGLDGTIFLGADKLYALDNNGTKKWDYAVTSSAITSPAIASDGTVYVSSSDNSLYAVNSNGALNWKFPTEGYLASSPAVASDGTIYVGSSDNNLYAVNPDGTLKWKFSAGGTVGTSPVIGPDGTIYMGSDDKNLYAVNPDGTKKWDFPTGGIIRYSVAIASDQTLYFGSDDANLYAVKPDGSERWEYGVGNRLQSTPIIGSDGTVYVSSYYGLSAFNSNGSSKWGVELGYNLGSPALGTEGTIYIASRDSLYAVGSNVKPNAPNGLYVSGRSTTEVNLTWQADSKATSYNIYRAKSSNGVYSKLGTSTDLSYTDNGLTPLTTYWYKVSSVNSYGESPLSIAVSAKSLDPNMPSGLKVVSANAHQADLSWNSVAGSTSYNIYRSQGMYGESYTLIGSTAEVKFSDIGLATYSDYQYKVSTVTQYGQSDPSLPVHVYISDIPNIPNISLKSIKLAPNSVIVGQDVSISLELGDNTQAVQGIYVQLKVSSSFSGTWCQYDPLTSTYAGKYTPTQANLNGNENSTLSISEIQINNNGFSQPLQADRDFTSPTVNVSDPGIHVSLSADKTTLTSNGRSITNVVANVVDKNGIAIPNVRVQFRSFFEGQGWYQYDEAQTDSSGKAITQLTSRSNPGTIYINVDVGGIKSPTDLEINCVAPVPTTVRLTAEKNTFDADGIYQVPLKVEVDDQNGSPMQGETAELSLQGIGQLSSNMTWAWSSWDNVVYNSPQVMYTVPSTPGTARIVAKVGAVESVPIQLTLESPQVAGITWNQEEVSLSVGYVSQAPIQATIYNRNGIGMQGQVVTFNLQGPGTLTTSVSTSQIGKYSRQGILETGIIAPSEIGEATISARIGAVESRPLPIHYVTSVPASISWYTPDTKFMLNADGKSSIPLKALVLDQTMAEWGSFGHAGESVIFTLTGPGSLSREVSGTDVQGIASVDLTAPDTPGSATLVASIGDLETPPITIDFVKVELGVLTMKIADSDMNQENVPILDADGTGQIPVKVTLIDTTGKPIVGQVIQFSNSEKLPFDAIGGITDTQGSVTVHLAAPANPQSVTLSATCGEAMISRLVYFDTPRARSVSWGFDNVVLGKDGTVINSQASLEVDGIAKGNAYVIVSDGNGVPLTGIKVKFSLDGDGTLENLEAITDSNGRAEARIIAPSKLGNAKIIVDIPELESYQSPEHIEWTLEYVLPTPGEVQLSTTILPTVTIFPSKSMLNFQD